MNFKLIIIIFILLTCFSTLYSQKTERFKLTVKTDTNQVFDAWSYGFDERASDTVDLALGEDYDLPGPPPDILWGLFQIYASDSTYSHLDLRGYPISPNDTVIYRFELFNLWHYVEFSWDKFPSNIIEAKLYDFYHEGFVDVDMLKTQSFRLDKQYFKLFEIRLRYDPSMNNIESNENSDNTVVFPNPVGTSPLKIISEKPIRRIEITSEDGKLISANNYQDDPMECEYDITALANGMYIVNIYYSNNFNNINFNNINFNNINYYSEKVIRKLIKK